MVQRLVVSSSGRRSSSSSSGRRGDAGCRCTAGWTTETADGRRRVAPEQRGLTAYYYTCWWWWCSPARLLLVPSRLAHRCGSSSHRSRTVRVVDHTPAYLPHCRPPAACCPPGRPQEGHPRAREAPGLREPPLTRAWPAGAQRDSARAAEETAGLWHQQRAGLAVDGAGAVRRPSVCLLLPRCLRVFWDPTTRMR